MWLANVNLHSTRQKQYIKTICLKLTVLGRYNMSYHHCNYTSLTVNGPLVVITLILEADPSTDASQKHHNISTTDSYGLLYGAEYEARIGQHYRGVHNQNVPCAVCHEVLLIVNCIYVHTHPLSRHKCTETTTSQNT